MVRIRNKTILKKKLLLQILTKYKYLVIFLLSKKLLMQEPHINNFNHFHRGIKEYIMPIKTTIDDVLTATEKKSIQEFKGKAKISDVSEYKSQQSGKTSIKVEFDVDGAKFSAYSGLTENSVKITLAKLVSILYALVGKAKTREIFTNIANDEETETEAELAIGLATEARKKLKKKEAFAEVERTIAEKDENGKPKRYNVKWYIPEAAEEAKKDPTDDFIDNIDN